MKVLIHNLQELNDFAARIAKELQPGDLVYLKGDLGAGKTTLAQNIIRFLTNDSDLEVTSPTFNLVHIYDAKNFKIWHLDLYRLQSPEEIYQLGVEEAMSTNAIVIIEWPEIAENLLPQSEIIEIKINFDDDNANSRIMYLNNIIAR